MIALDRAAMQARYHDVGILASPLQPDATRRAVDEVGITSLANDPSFFQVKWRANFHGDFSCHVHVPPREFLSRFSINVDTFCLVEQDRDAFPGNIISQELVLHVFFRQDHFARA